MCDRRCVVESGGVAYSHPCGYAVLHRYNALCSRVVTLALNQRSGNELMQSITRVRFSLLGYNAVFNIIGSCSVVCYVFNGVCPCDATRGIEWALRLT